jgi:phosphate transport system substrate-binding protein
VKRISLGIAAAMLLAFCVTGCKQSANTTATPASQSSAQNLNGAGATFPYPVYSKWFSEYASAHPGIHINYQSIGSGGGIRQVTEGTIDFGASDGPMTDQQIAESKVAVMHIPTVLGAVVPVYNIPGVTGNLNLAPDVIADIYLGKIKKWDDPRLAKDNPGVKFPSTAILPVYRSDGSGTTYIFTDFLSKISPDWAKKVGKSTSVKWPVGIGQKGNEGVAGMVRQSPSSFGYVELIYALQNKMTYGAVRNASGKFVLATTDGVTAAAAAAAATMPADYRVSITNASGDASYPISSFTWFLIPTHSQNTAKTETLKNFLTWMLDHGESEASSMGYAPLPTQVQAMVRKSIADLH